MCETLQMTAGYTDVVEMVESIVCLDRMHICLGMAPASTARATSRVACNHGKGQDATVCRYNVCKQTIQTNDSKAHPTSGGRQQDRVRRERLPRGYAGQPPVCLPLGAATRATSRYATLLKLSAMLGMSALGCRGFLVLVLLGCLFGKLSATICGMKVKVCTCIIPRLIFHIALLLRQKPL